MFAKINFLGEDTAGIVVSNEDVDNNELLFFTVVDNRITFSCVVNGALQWRRIFNRKSGRAINTEDTMIG